MSRDIVADSSLPLVIFGDTYPIFSKSTFLKSNFSTQPFRNWRNIFHIWHFHIRAFRFWLFWPSQHSFFNVFLSVYPIWLPIFFVFFHEWTRIGCRNLPCHGLTHFYIVFWIIRDLNPWPLDREPSLLITRPDLHP